jgi:hypothetical protein
MAIDSICAMGSEDESALYLYISDVITGETTEHTHRIAGLSEDDRRFSPTRRASK